jgi:hypothetical protein
VSSADLHHRGYLTNVGTGPDNRMWAQDDELPDLESNYGYGRYTRYGDVLPLLTARDDMYAIMRHGDEILLSFDGVPPPVDGMQRAYLVRMDLYYKVYKDPPQTIDPLPFHAMTRYPYLAPEAYPTDPAHVDYLNSYNTREYIAP